MNLLKGTRVFNSNQGVTMDVGLLQSRLDAAKNNI